MAKILAVDDDSDILFTVQVTFEGSGHEVVATVDPQRVMELIDAECPDAVVLDIMMPHVSGWDLLTAIRARPELEALPVLMLTALSEVSHRVRGLRRGADDYLAKPFDPAELLARVERMVERRDRLDDSHVRWTPPTLDLRADLAEVPNRTRNLEQAVALLERRVRLEERLGEVRLGRYEVRRLIGQGAMGLVFEGWDPKLRRAVALKTIRLDGVETDREVQVSRLLHEAMTAARIHHPNVVTVFDAGDEGTAAFIAMELVDGPALDEVLRHHLLSVGLTIPLAVAICQGLEVAHRSGLVHRDVKPANVLLGRDGSIKVTDFGIADLVAVALSSEDVFGTPGFLAPECLKGGPGTERSDLFALGVVLYQCFTGSHPFLGRTWGATLRNTSEVDAPALTEKVPGIPAAVSRLVDSLLDKRPGRRPSSAREVADVFAEHADRLGLAWSLDAALAGASSSATGLPVPHSQVLRRADLQLDVA